MYWTVQDSNPDQLCSPLSLLFIGYQGSFLGAKWPRHDVAHSPLFGPKVKHQLNCTFTLPVCVYDRTGAAVPLPLPLNCSMSHVTLQRLCSWLSQALIWQAIANVWQSGTRQFKLCITSAVKWDPHVASWCTVSNLCCILVSGCGVSLLKLPFLRSIFLRSFIFSGFRIWTLP
jgi:hypothetical protein